MTDPKAATLAALTAQAAAESAPQFTKVKQPPLRDLGPDERLVRIAGFYFILPCQWTLGDTLDQNATDFINTAWHTSIINRFGTIKAALGAIASTTYDDLDRELQAFAADFTYTPRPTRIRDPKLEVDAELLSFARPIFNKHVGGKGLPRGDYERLLREWVTANEPQLREAFDAENAGIKRLTETISGQLGDIATDE